MRSLAALAALSLCACSTFQPDTAAVRLGQSAADARQQEGWQRRTYIYSAANLTTSQLPPALVKARQSGPSFTLLRQCDPATPAGPTAQAAAPAALLPLLMFMFNAVTGQIERAIKAREKQRLASLSDQFIAKAAMASFPLSPSSAVSCIVIDDVEMRTSDDGQIVQLQPRALYALQLRRLGRAFVIEPFARIEQSKIIKGSLARALNVDLSLALTAVMNTKTQLPAIHGYPAYNVHMQNVALGLNHGPTAQMQSIVMPLPQDADTPTSITAVVTESHVTLAREQERVVLEQANRDALWKAAAEMLKTELSD